VQQVIHASLHGNAFAFETAGYEGLRAYLDRAAAQLSADPDRDEILADLEQAIADKCARQLAPHKSVVTTAEMARVLEEMGPVGAPAEVGPDAPPPAKPAPSGPVRRLYRVLEGGKLAGLCNGLGAFFGIDANVVRVIFVVLTLITHGAWLLVYLVLMFVVPAAGTPEERAAARGLPFSAQQLIDEAKRHYATLEQELQGPWAWWRSQLRGTWQAQRQERQARRQDWRASRREARRVASEARHAAQAGWSAPGAPPPQAPTPAGAPAPPPAPPAVQAPWTSFSPAHYAQQVAASLVVSVMAFLSAAITVGLVVVSAQLLVTGRVLGWTPGLPLWASLLIAVLVAMVFGRPFSQARSALHRALHRASHPGGVAWLAAWDGILWVGFVVLFGWLAWHQSPEVRALVQDLPGAWEKVRASWLARPPG
jgi:phage shock protein PspC (stress-responsive transcriptional regulator)